MAIDGLERFPSARDIEKVARNPECETLRTALAGNLDLRKYAVAIGLEEERQSPLAIQRGDQVERFVLGKEAKILVEKMVEDGRLAPDPVVEDLGSHRAKNRAGMEKAARRADEHITALLAGRPVPDLLIHPVLSVPLGADIQFIEPDALVRYAGTDVYEPLELKSYPFREGRTDPEDLRQARRQGAVYVKTLRDRVVALGGDPATIEAHVTLVFTAPGSNYPRPVYGETVEGEMRDVELAFRLLDVARTGLPEVLDGKDITDVLPTLSTHYVEECLRFCSLAKSCRGRARDVGAPAVLGEFPARIIAPAGNIERAAELLAGKRPANDAEAAMARRLIELVDEVGRFEEAI